MRAPFILVAAVTAAADPCRFTIPVEVDANKRVAYVAYGEAERNTRVLAPLQRTAHACGRSKIRRKRPSSRRAPVGRRYDESQTPEAAATNFCELVGAVGDGCVSVLTKAVARRATWQCDGRTRPPGR